MTAETEGGRFIRLMSAKDPNKAYQQLADLARKGSIMHGMVVAELHDGTVHVVGQRSTADDMVMLIGFAVEALRRVPPEQRGPQSKAEAQAPPRPRREPETYPPTIAGEWASLSDAIFNDETSEVQRTECRRAFYGGAASLFRLIMSQSDAGDEPTKADLDRMSGWSGELDAFSADLERGLA
jgi:hypothetical protein